MNPNRALLPHQGRHQGTARARELYHQDPPVMDNERIEEVLHSWAGGASTFESSIEVSGPRAVSAPGFFPARRQGSGQFAGAIPFAPFVDVEDECERPAKTVDFRPPKNYHPADDRLHAIIVDKLAENADIKAEGISIVVQDGEVSVSGLVESGSMKEAIVECIGQIVGVQKVLCHIETAVPPI